MKTLVKNVAIIATLGGTALLLLADSARRCPQPGQSVRFAVSGNCGPSGTLALSVERDQCYFKVEGAEALGLPKEGDFGESINGQYNLQQGGWVLKGYADAPPAGVDAGTSDGGPNEPMYYRQCEARRVGNHLELPCSVSIEQGGRQGEPVPYCKATLTPQG